MIRPIMKDSTGKPPRVKARFEKEFVKEMKAYTKAQNVEMKAMFVIGRFIRFDVAKAHASDNYDRKAKTAVNNFITANPIPVPYGYVSARAFVKFIGYEETYMSTLFGRIPQLGDRLSIRNVMYISSEQQRKIMNYRLDSEKFDRKEHFRKNVVVAGARGTAIGMQAKRFSEWGIRGNYFSDYVTDNFGSAEYERYVNGKERIDAFAVVDGVAHIVEFKTGGVHPMSHKKQVLGYAKGIRDEGYSDIKITILYYDERSSSVSWTVNVDELDDDYNEVVDYLSTVNVNARSLV